MPIQDSDSDRRNLSITSILFIVYFFAGGRLSNSTVQLQVINAEFSRPYILAIISWIIFFWFLYKYWLSHRGQFFSEFADTFSNWKDKKYIRDYVFKRLSRERPNEEIAGTKISEIGWNGFCVSLVCGVASIIQRNANGEPVSFTVPLGRGGDMYMTDLKGWLLGIRATVECIFSKPSFSDHLAPYLLAFMAMCGGLIRFVF